METERSSCLQSPPLGPYLNHMIHCTASHPIYLKSILISSHLRLGLASALFSSKFFHQNFKNEFLLSLVCATCRTHLSIRDLIILIMYCEKRNHEAPHYTIFWSPPSYAQISSLVLCSWIRLACAFPLACEIKFHTHTKNLQHHSSEYRILNP